MVVLVNQEAILLIWATDIPVVLPIHAAEALQVMCCLNILVSIPASAMRFLIQMVKVCKVLYLKGLVRVKKKLLSSACCSRAILTKYSFKERTRQIEVFLGNAKTFNHPLKVPPLKG